MDKNGKNQDDLQDLNRSSIIRHLAMHEGCSRVDLAKITGLKPASITKIMRILMENGVVSETGFTEGLKGRRSIGLALNYYKYQVIGVKIAWEHLILGVFDLNAHTYG
jgi:transcription initiation factor IIE alpha subunit